MELRKATYRDWDFILQVRNEGKDGFMDAELIDSETHELFMSENGKGYFIASVKGMDVGFIGEVQRDVRLAIHPDCTGKGYGSKMIELYTGKFSKEDYLSATVKPDNIASIKSFEKAGWIMQPITFRPMLKRKEND
jgi:ribosomal protein S18 acetylase RimI-like enzyme|tara:strand:- start:204 stop:611 length:408 start_codon:yes stop_codon:yes gene_type:complete